MIYGRIKFRRLSGMLLVVTVLLSAQPRNTFAQDSGATPPLSDGSRDASLPGTEGNFPQQPQPHSDPQSVQAQLSPAEASASISGIVQDVTGATVAGAELSLTDSNRSQQSMVVSGANGEFTFSQIPPGSYRVTVNAQDLEPFQSAEIVVTAQQVYEMPAILLRVATANTQLTVRPTEEVAAIQIKAHTWDGSEFLYELHLRRRSTHHLAKVLACFSQCLRSD
jgi:hypothetical protein